MAISIEGLCLHDGARCVAGAMDIGVAQNGHAR
jgi:hypothetical protein